MGNVRSIPIENISSARIKACFGHYEEGGVVLKTQLLDLMEELLSGSGRDVPEMTRRLISFLHPQTKPDVTLLEFRDAFFQLDEVDLTESTLNESVTPVPKRVFDEKAMEDTGHVFILCTDIRRLSCDTYLLPTGPSLLPGKHWQYGFLKDSPFDNFSNDPDFDKFVERRWRRVKNWPAHLPEPILVNTHAKITSSPALFKESLSHSTEGVDLVWIHDALSMFLTQALALINSPTASGEKRKPRNGRKKFLIALPLLASGGGGANSLTGTLIREVYPVLLSFANAQNVDLALATIDPSVLAVMQSERRRFDAISGGRVWCQLPEKLREEGDKLAELIKKDKLVK